MTGTTIAIKIKRQRIWSIETSRIELSTRWGAFGFSRFSRAEPCDSIRRYRHQQLSIVQKSYKIAFFLRKLIVSFNNYLYANYNERVTSIYAMLNRRIYNCQIVHVLKESVFLRIGNANVTFFPAPIVYRTFYISVYCNSYLSGYYTRSDEAD